MFIAGAQSIIQATRRGIAAMPRRVESLIFTFWFYKYHAPNGARKSSSDFQTMLLRSLPSLTACCLPAYQ